MPSGDFLPHVEVVHTSNTPNPILPVNYCWFLRIDLPRFTRALPLANQLLIARQATKQRLRVVGPFGRILAFAFHRSQCTTIYLTRAGELIDPPDLVKERTGHTSDSKRKQRFVIGWRLGQSVQLVGHGDKLIGQDNLKAARTYRLLRDAIGDAEAKAASVFELTREQRRNVFRELRVDLELVSEAPYDGCYHVSDLLLAGPTFVTLSNETTVARIVRLIDSGVGLIVSVCSRGELAWLDERTKNLDLHEFVDHRLFGIVDGSVPTKDLMRVILDTIDEALKVKKTFVNSVGGRGRSALVLGCWIARHGLAFGEAALNHLTEVRYKSGLSAPSPETNSQREFVAQWRPGE